MSINDEILRRQAELEKLFGRRTRNLETQLLKEYTKAFKEIKKKLLDLYSKFGETPTLYQASQYNRLTNLNNQISEILTKLNKTQTASITTAYKKEFGNGYYGVGYQLEQGLGASLRFGLLDPQVIKQSIENPLSKVKWQENHTIELAKLKNRLSSELTQGIIQGRSPQKTASEIRKKLGTHFNNNIPRIVRTETLRARSWGTYTGDLQARQIAKEAGISFSREWLATVDERTRQDHAEMDGVKENKNGEFVLPDGTVTVAPLLSGVPEQDINCRCTTVDVVDDTPPKDQYVNELGKSVPYKNYKTYRDNWIKSRKSPVKEPPDLAKKKPPSEKPKPKPKAKTN